MHETLSPKIFLRHALTAFMLAFWALLGCATAQAAQDVRLLRIGTGGLLGVYYPIGKALAEGITIDTSTPELIAVAQTSGGSVDNVQAMLAGEIEAGLVQADVALLALRGEGSFTGAGQGGLVRALATLYPERLQIVTRRDAHIHSVMDLRGKSFSLDEAGSGTLAVMRLVLEAHGLTEKDFNPVYLKPEFTTENLASGKLQGFSLMAGTPTQAISDIIDQELFLVPIAPEVAARINQHHPYLVPGVIPAETYPGVPKTTTIEVHALLLVRKDLDEALVYGMTAALWSEHTQSLLQKAHLQGHSVTLESALLGLSVPLHPGAQRFYQEQGLLPQGSPAP